MSISSKFKQHAAEAIAAERCVVELQRGREIRLTHGDGSCTATLVETLDSRILQHVHASGPCQLVLTAHRARVLGRHMDAGVAVLDLPPGTPLGKIRRLAGLEDIDDTLPRAEQWQAAASESAVAAMQLARHAHCLPAVLLYAEPVCTASVMQVSINGATEYKPDTGALIRMSSTRIPLSSAASVELTVFKERQGSAEHVAIIVGHPDMSHPVITRLHSSCYTGDILGSMRCDCGEQLSGAISSMARAGGGVVLYISQEGRGIGLASKLRAYQLQDQGLDTIEANQHLGFGADERNYQAASTMLHSLGIQRIRLVTNNPLKIDALRRQGVDVVGRLPSHATVNAHNARYLQTKRDRAGHLSTSVESAV